MRGFNQEEFNGFVVDQGVVNFFRKSVRLKSGRLSNWYVNWRNVAGDVYLIDRLADYVIAFVGDLGLKPACFYGVPEGASKLGVITQYKWAKRQRDYGPGVYPLPMGRGRVKGHGDPGDRYFVGTPRGDTVVLEDVTTTGGSLLGTINNLLDAGIPVIASIGLTDRNELGSDGRSVREAVLERKIPYYAMSNALELLPEAYRRFCPGEDAARLVEEYFERYGAGRIKLI